ncbi:MAG: cytochrome c [Pseudomonadota bacterium]|nr:cytochrome c [Pseudomonadota bacterium]
MRFLFLISTLVIISFQSSSNDFEKALDTIELRKASMQGIWARVKRLSPFIDVDTNLDYDQNLAIQDAKDIKLLLEKSKDLWPRSTNLSTKNLTNATPAIWAVEEYFNKLYANAEIAASKLEKALEKNDWESVDLQMCNLGNACGTCHASFRRLLTSQLANEASAWSGKYISDCK